MAVDLSGGCASWAWLSGHVVCCVCLNNGNDRDGDRGFGGSECGEEGKR